jgi:hypothetical protein
VTDGTHDQPGAGDGYEHHASKTHAVMARDVAVDKDRKPCDREDDERNRQRAHRQFHIIVRGL